MNHRAKENPIKLMWGCSLYGAKVRKAIMTQYRQ